VARSPAEIAANFDTVLSGTEAGLVGVWTFDDGTAGDGTPNGNEGGLVGNATIVPNTFCPPPPVLPVPDVKINGGNGTVLATLGSSVNLTFSLNAGECADVPGDWWVIRQSFPFTIVSFQLVPFGVVPGIQPVVTAPLFDLAPVTLPLGAGLTPGLHTYYFAVDRSADGILNGDTLSFDAASVLILAP
jgi:hypothetical protein